MKQLIAELPMLVAPMEKEELIVYLAAAKETVSTVLMTERETKQMPIYFVSRALRGPEINYTSMGKLVLALVHANKRLRRYFQAHPIIVITDQPMHQVLSRPEVAGRLQKWSIELEEYAIHYRPIVSVKGHILADFIVERLEEDSTDTLMEVEEELPEPWILFTDGSSCTDGYEAGLILINPEGMEFTYALRFRFDATNNEAKYEALIVRLRIAKQMGVKNLQANVDSRLVANQVNGTYVAKEADMIRYLEKVRTLTSGFKAFTIRQVPRSENKKADALRKIVSISFAHLSKQVLVEELKEKSITEEAFKQMKQLIAELPMLVAPMEKEELIVYLAAAKETVSTVLMTERETKQMPIYFVSRALRGPEINYTSMGKLVLALVHANKRLRRYFQAHPIIVITDQPMHQVLSRPEVAGRLQKWSIELEEYAIHYRPIVSVKGHILADFIVERLEEDSTDTLMEVEEELPEPWILFTDGSSCTDGYEAGLILINPEGMEFTYALRFRFDATNNEAKYEALIVRLRIAKQMGVKNLQANVDSRLVANQVNGTYVAKEADMIRYLEKETLPADVKKARAVRHKSQRFVVLKETLYKKSFLGPWLRCVGPLQADYVLREIHEGSCSMHAGTRSIMAKALRIGYYWPTMHKDARTLIKACQDCQVHKPVPRNPQQKLTTIASP
nr:reverse transcriptase domain-containing protein [Tanacetum cinerariifolium]